MHDNNQTIIKERIHLDTDKNFLVDEITTIDHALWSYRRKLVTARIGKAAYRGGA